jgi:hypothetical protein
VRRHIFAPARVFMAVRGTTYIFFNSGQVQDVSGPTAKINLESFNVTHDVQILVIPESYDVGGVDVLENFQ